MSGIHGYGVVKGRVSSIRPERDHHKPHFQLFLRVGSKRFAVPVNVRSSEGAPDLLFLVDEHFRHPLTEELRGLGDGFHPVEKRPGGIALDYIRGNLFDRERMEILPHDAPGEDDDLNDRLARVTRRAVGDPNVAVYAFGSRFPGGVHDVHMNQGNPRGRFFGDNGVFQDGALLVHHTRTDRWTAVFLAFQSQAWHTDERGNPLREGAHTGPRVSPEEPDKVVRIVSAVVNPPDHDPGKETVTLLNTTARAIDLRGWKILNRQNETHKLDGTLPPNAPLVVRLPETLQLSNKGGTITLLDERGLKVHGVAYTQGQASREGRQLVFGG